MKKKSHFLGLLAVCLLGGLLIQFGCEGDRGRTGPPGPPGPGPEALARGVDSPNSSLCYSCHQHDNVGILSNVSLRAHMDNMGGEMFGGSAHGEEPPEGCVACHGGFRPGGGRPDGLNDELHAGFQHQQDRTPSIWGSRVDEVEVSSGIVAVTFVIEDARAEDAPDEVNIELTLAKEVSEGSWMSMLQRTRERGLQTDPLYGDGVKVIRGGNLRLEDDDILTGGVAVDDGMQFTTEFMAAPRDYGNDTSTLQSIDFSGGAVWRRADDLAASTYDDNAAYQTWVQGIINEINEIGTWEAGTYRVSITGRDRPSGYVRFAAVADFELTGSGANATVVTGSLSEPRPTNQIMQASCNTCHGERLSFPRNQVHGQQRPAVSTCFNCHNDYTWDSRNSVAEIDGWASLDMNTMIHSIHSGIDGYVADAYLYEDVSFPDWTLAGTSNCTSCHVGEIPARGMSWNRRDGGVASTCATCHGEGGYAFDTAVTEDHGAVRGYNCSECHGPDGTVADFNQAADGYHGVSARLEALRAQREDFSFELIGLEDAVYNATPVVRWQVLDAAGDPITLTDEIIDGGPRLHIGWGYGDDWTNEGSGEKSAFGARENDDGGRPVAVNVATGEGGNTVIEENIAITTFPTFTNEAAGGGQGYADLEQARAGRHGFVAIHRNIYDNGATRLLTSLVQPITLGAGEVALAEGRRNTINATTNIDPATNRGGSCLSCHGTIAWHGNGYTADNNIQACITCHNAGSHMSIAVASPDPPHSVDMMYLMHKAHSDPGVLYPQDFAGRCHACHTGNDPHPLWDDEEGFIASINRDVWDENNCNLCHDGETHPGRIGIISDWPSSIEAYGLRGDGTDDGHN